MVFQTNYNEILKCLNTIDPENYSKTRNFKDGAVTYLGPYISRGVISTRFVYEHICLLKIPWESSEKLIQELAWRDYWQQIWIWKGDAIHSDFRNEQNKISNYKIPRAIIEANTGIQAVDKAIESLYLTGYMHNHMRMYVASICCNIANSHWLTPSKWMYSHLFDGDVASNQLSWQWVAGTFSNKQYFANQSNINKFFKSQQQNSFLDIPYEAFANLSTPEILKETSDLKTPLVLPKIDDRASIINKPTLIYNYYNIDPIWHLNENFQRIFLLEPSIFEKYIVSEKCINFSLALTKNIPNIKIFIGEFNELCSLINPNLITFKEHPLNNHYKGKKESRVWLTDISGYFPSFFSFWKKCKKELQYEKK
ncbi:hypothetical protein KH5_01990 [Urechidicola sp. KH5]